MAATAVPENPDVGGENRRDHGGSRKLAYAIARRIVGDIATRGLPPGTRLPPEAVMLERFDVGRASLREALRILEIQGLVRLKPGPGGGPVVAAPSSQDFGRMATLHFHAAGATFRELVEARMVIEPVMARLAASRRDPEMLARLRHVLAEAQSADLDDDRRYLATSTDFHGVVSGISGNRVLDLYGRSLKDVFTDRVEGIVFPIESRASVREAHAAIAQAIERGHAAAAERLMRTHMEDYVRYVEEHYPGLLDEVVDWR